MSNETNLQNTQQPPPPPKKEIEFPRVVTLESLEALPDVGPVSAEKLYHKIAAAGGFGDFKKDAWVGGLPPLSLDGIAEERKATIVRILQEK